MSLPSDRILDLGKRFVKELGLDQSADTLSRWMAHHLAGLIVEAENAQGDERATKAQKCSELMLKLWKHRYELPKGKRPFEEFEPILRALESLDPESTVPRYYRAAVEQSGEVGETKKWLELVKELDYTAKMLINYGLVHAAQIASDKAKDWVALAEAAGVDDRFDLIVVRYIANEADLTKEDALNEAQRKEIQDRLQRLECFQTLATILADELRERLHELTA